MKALLRILYYLSVIVLTVVIVICGIHVGQFYLKNHNEKKAQKAVTDMVKDVSGQQKEGYSFTHEAWDKLYEMDSNIIGFMAFDDGFVEEPIVHYTDNDYYLRRWIDGSWSDMGTVFVDANNDLDDTNITIYGHHVYYDATDKFSPLTTLVEQDAYDQHHEFRIWYKDHVVRYVITHVYNYDMDVDYEFNFKQPEFADKEDFEQFLKESDQRNLIQAADVLEYGDRFITLQTCKKYSDTVRHIIVCKAVEDKPY